jgi:hypothetical protein
MSLTADWIAPAEKQIFFYKKVPNFLDINRRPRNNGSGHQGYATPRWSRVAMTGRGDRVLRLHRREAGHPVPGARSGPGHGSQDTILDEVWLPAPDAGDRVLIGNAGAYTTCYSGRSVFNGYPAPAVRVC